MQLHPAVLASERYIDSVATDVELARQKYRPSWGLSAQYGYRTEDPLGRDRDDLVSFGLTFDLPLFRSDRQDRQVNAAVARESAAWTDRTLLIRRLVAELESTRDEAIVGDQGRVQDVAERKVVLVEVQVRSLAARHEPGRMADGVAVEK